MSPKNEYCCFGFSNAVEDEKINFGDWDKLLKRRKCYTNDHDFYQIDYCPFCGQEIDDKERLGKNNSNGYK